MIRAGLVERLISRWLLSVTDSIFIWLKRTYPNTEAHAIAAGLVQEINAWWARKLSEEQQLENFLEIEFDTLYAKFFMPTRRQTPLATRAIRGGKRPDANKSVSWHVALRPGLRRAL